MRLRIIDMNIGIACVVGRPKKNRKYKCGTWSLVSIKKHIKTWIFVKTFVGVGG